MGITKTDQYTPAQVRNALMLKALGHPARLAIVEHLLRVQSCVCGDLVLELPLAQATVSQHLRELKEAGIIKGTVEGTSVCYCVDPAAIRTLHGLLGGMALSLVSNTQCC